MTKQVIWELEDYLDGILPIEPRKRSSRVRETAEALTVAKSAVTAQY